MRTLPARAWTLLVQGVNLHVKAADALLRRFRFLPYARLDDLMVSYAAPGGGVGPHLDAYDVFLLQGFGRRRWRYGRAADQAFRSGLPLRILRRFDPAHDSVLTPGDLLYLPPEYAHDGVALDACTTYSIGFRAPSAAELAGAFLSYLQDTLELTGRYADPDLRPTRQPARIGRGMQRKIARMLAGVRWDADMVTRFLGTTLSEPKPSVFFEPPDPPLARAAFLRRIARVGLQLDLRTQLLYDDARFYINGDASTATRCLRNQPGSSSAWPTSACSLRQRCSTPARPCCAPPTTGTDMATSIPAAPDLPPAPTERLLDTVADQVEAIDTLVARARSSVRVFDGDMSQMGWNRPARIDALVQFLGGSPDARLQIIVHDTRYLQSACPRLVALLRQRSAVMTIYRTGPEARAASDPLVIADDRHFLHRFHVDQPRASLALDAPALAVPLVRRFTEIWATGEPGIDATVLGL